MAYVEPVLSAIAVLINLFSVFLLVWGVGIGLIQFFRSRLQPHSPEKDLYTIGTIKNTVGIYVLFSLEVLIAADIIESIIHPNLDDLLRLGGIVAIRTVISFFLNKEIQEAEKHEPEKNRDS